MFNAKNAFLKISLSALYPCEIRQGVVEESAQKSESFYLIPSVTKIYFKHSRTYVTPGHVIFHRSLVKTSH